MQMIQILKPNSPFGPKLQKCQPHLNNYKGPIAEKSAIEDDDFERIITRRTAPNLTRFSKYSVNTSKSQKELNTSVKKRPKFSQKIQNKKILQGFVNSNYQ